MRKDIYADVRADIRSSVAKQIDTERYVRMLRARLLRAEKEHGGADEKSVAQSAPVAKAD